MPGQAPPAERLTTDLTHASIERNNPFFQAVSPRLVPDTVEDDLAQVGQAGSAAQRGEQIHLAFPQQTQAQAAIRCQAGARAQGDTGPARHRTR